MKINRKFINRVVRFTKRNIGKYPSIDNRLRSVKSRIDLYARHENQSGNRLYPVSAEGLMRLMPCNKSLSKCNLSKSKLSIPEVKNEEKLRVDHFVESYSNLNGIAKTPAKMADAFIFVVGKRFFKDKALGETHDLLAIAIKENPESKVYFLPSQNELVNNRAVIEGLPEVVICLPLETNSIEVLSKVERVYTVSSTWGFDALLMGKRIDVFGTPFYACSDSVNYRGPNNIQKADTASVIHYFIIEGGNYASPLNKEKIPAELALVWLHLKREDCFNGFFSKAQSFKHIQLERTFEPVNPDYIAFIEGLLEFCPDKTSITYSLTTKMINGGIPDGNDIALLANNYPFSLPVLYDGFESLHRNLIAFDTMCSFIETYVETMNSLQFSSIVAQDVRFKIYSLLATSYRLGRGRKYGHMLEICSTDLDYREVGFKNYCKVIRLLGTQFRYPELLESLGTFISTSRADWFQITQVFYKTASYDSMRVDKDWYARVEIQNSLSDKYLDLARSEGVKWAEAIYFALKEDAASCSSSTKAYLSNNVTNSKLSKVELLFLLKTLLGYHKHELALQVIDVHKGVLSQDDIESVEISSEKTLPMEYIAQNSGKLIPTKTHNAILTKLRHEGLYSEALDFIEKQFKLKKYSVSENAIKKHERNTELFTFLAKAKYLANSQSVEDFKGVVFLTHGIGHIPVIAISTPVIPELNKKGYYVISLSQEANIANKTGVDELDKYIGSLTVNCNDGQLLLDWHIDWDNKVVSCGGINYYQGIYEHLSIRFRSFHIDIKSPGVKRLFDTTLLQCDLSLRVCNQIKADTFLSNKPVVFFGGACHRAPGSVFRDFSLNSNTPNFFFSAYNIGYEKYYLGKSNKFSSTLTVLDMTVNKNCRAGFLAIPSQFDEWMSNQDNILQAKQSVSKLIEMQRGIESEGRVYSSTEKILEARAKGKKIICCFGKLLFDLAVPYDGGPAHENIADWITHTYDLVSNNPNILLLVKPHPGEVVPENSLDIQEYFRDLLPRDLSSNVIFLGHNEYKVPELAPLLDLAILYNGTSALELSILGVPVMMTSHFGKHDYPIDLLYPDSRLGYEVFVNSLDYGVPNESLKERAAGLLYYMGTDNVSLLNNYSLRAATNDYTGTPKWSDEEIDKYVRDGIDLHMEKAASKALEGATAYLKGATC